MSNTPKRSSTAKAQEAAAKGYVEVEWEGETYRTIVAGDDPVVTDVMEEMEDGRILKSLHLLYGDEEYNRWRKTRPTPKDVGEFLRKTSEALGVSMGEADT